MQTTAPLATVDSLSAAPFPPSNLTSSCTERRSLCLLLPAGESARLSDREFGRGPPLLVAIFVVSPPPAPPPPRRPKGKHSSRSRPVPGRLACPRDGSLLDFEEGSIPLSCGWEEAAATPSGGSVSRSICRFEGDIFDPVLTPPLSIRPAGWQKLRKLTVLGAAVAKG